MPIAGIPNAALRPVRVALGSRLPAFDSDGCLVANAQEIGHLVEGQEHSIIETFLNHYLRTIPEARRPSQPHLEAYAIEAAQALQAQLSALDVQIWADEVQRYWVLVSGEVEMLTVVRGALAAQYSHIARIIFEQVAGEPERCQRLLGAIMRVAWLEDCVLGNYFSEIIRTVTDDRERRADVFRQCIEEGVTSASELGVELRDLASKATAATQGMLSKASEVAAAAEQSTQAMEQAASMAAGLIRAIEDARAEIDTAAQIATRASAQLDDSVKVSEALSETASTVESILQLIRDVAGQTKLLSLNAAIEASRWERSWADGSRIGILYR